VLVLPTIAAGCLVKACVESECVFFFGDDEFCVWFCFQDGYSYREADDACAEDEDVAVVGSGFSGHVRSVVDSFAGNTDCDWAGGWINGSFEY